MKTRRQGPPGDECRRQRHPPRRPERPHPVADLLYGRNAVLEALRGRRKSRRLLLAQGVREDDRIQTIIRTAASAGATVERLPRAEIDLLLGSVNHQGVALDAGPYPYTGIDQALARPGTILALDHLQDPQNFGSLLRAAEATGVVAVLIPADRAVGVTPAVVNASAGAVEHIQVVVVSNLARALDEAKEAGWWVAGLASNDTSADLFQERDLPSPLVLVVGGEGSGIGPNVLKRCDLLLEIPMVGKVASLNAATAGAIALFELYRRER